MTSTLPDFSNKPDLLPLAQVVQALRAAGVGEDDCLLIGAAARDLWLKHGYDIDPGRETLDTDFAVAVADWDAYFRMREALIASGEFAPRQGSATHRLRHRSGAPLDVIPFGGVERLDRTIAWPPAQTEVFDCFGLREALADSCAMALPGGVAVRVASIPALALLKLTAWRDRKHERRDAKDLLLYLRKYLDCDQLDRAATECPDLFEVDDFDYEVIGARLLGRHMGALLDANAAAVLLPILAGEVDPQGNALLAHQSGLEISRACRLLQALSDELADVAKTSKP